LGNQFALPARKGCVGGIARLSHFVALAPITILLKVAHRIESLGFWKAMSQVYAAAEKQRWRVQKTANVVGQLSE
jgi:hypothetical protein